MTTREYHVPGYKGGITLHLSDVETVDLPKQVSRKERDTPLENRRIIAWDGEGMKLSGDDKPQHYVLFGCSAEPQFGLVSRDLNTMQLLEYIVAVGGRYPNAVHVGYGFRYDANMIIRNLPNKHLRTLKEKGDVTFHVAPYRWRIHWIPGKSLRVTKRWSTGKRNKGKRSGDGYISVKIDDMVSFFACPFLDACESILQDVLTDDDRQVIAHGKAARKDNTWDDLRDVKLYWKKELRLMEMMANRFRDVMFEAGIMLRDWYGPGAIASYLISKRGLRDHIQNTPEIKEVHEAAKVAYAGGRFELFRVGRVQGPVYGYDINSAYPAALSHAPSLGMARGNWVHITSPKSIAEFGVYRITYNHRGKSSPIEYAAMPLFHRDHRGSITFPQYVNGWYWSPEAAAVAEIGNRFPGSVTIHEGWVWEHDGTYPWEFLADMFEERIRLGKKNVISIPYKLGPNSMYGKLAQRVGWNQKDNTPPRSHCLALAGWITSACRANLLKIMVQIPAHKLIAVETDGIFTTTPPDELRANFGDGLGEWGAESYDEMLYLQNGVYHLRRGDTWKPPKARGLDVASVSRDVVDGYFRSCRPGEFPPLHVEMRERFIGLNAAWVKGRGIDVKAHLGRWERGTREMEPGGRGKRVHISKVCAECQLGLSAWESSHRLAIKSRSMGEMSTPHNLPWENVPVPEDMARFRANDLMESDLLVL